MEDFESVSKEQLISILQTKSKSISSLEKKLSKIEEKYVKIFKVHKLALKDRDLCLNFLHQHELTDSLQIPFGECTSDLWESSFEAQKKEWQSS